MLAASILSKAEEISFDGAPSSIRIALMDPSPSSSPPTLQSETTWAGNTVAPTVEFPHSHPRSSYSTFASETREGKPCSSAVTNASAGKSCSPPLPLHPTR
eukprot:748290-Rhodomonas_salina.5